MARCFGNSGKLYIHWTRYKLSPVYGFFKHFHTINIDSWQTFNQSHCKCFKYKTMEIKAHRSPLSDEILWASWMWMWPVDFLNTRGCQRSTGSHASHVTSTSCGKSTVQLKTKLFGAWFSWSVLRPWWNWIIIPNMLVIQYSIVMLC